MAKNNTKQKKLEPNSMHTTKNGTKLKIVECVGANCYLCEVITRNGSFKTTVAKQDIVEK